MKADWIPEIKDLKDMSQGYVLGSQLLSLLAPENPDQKTVTVPVDLTYERTVQDGVADRDIIAKQTRTAVDLLHEENPDRIITLGGECSVSTPVFTWMSKKYDGDVAAQYEVCALTIAEPLPRRAIQIRTMLRDIHLFK